MGSLDGKVVLITGAAGGIGRATARHLHDEGASVVATSSGSSSVKELAEEFDSGRWIARGLDVTDERDVASAVDFTVTTYGRMDGIVNNAGILIPNDVVAATGRAAGGRRAGVRQRLGEPAPGRGTGTADRRFRRLRLRQGRRVAGIEEFTRIKQVVLGLD